MADLKFPSIFFLYDDDQQMKNLQNEMMDLGFLWVEE